MTHALPGLVLGKGTNPSPMILHAGGPAARCPAPKKPAMKTAGHGTGERRGLNPSLGWAAVQQTAATEQALADAATAGQALATGQDQRVLPAWLSRRPGRGTRSGRSAMLRLARCER